MQMEVGKEGEERSNQAKACALQEILLPGTLFESHTEIPILWSNSREKKGECLQLELKKPNGLKKGIKGLDSTCEECTHTRESKWKPHWPLASFPPLPWHVPQPEPRAHSGPTGFAVPLCTGWELPRDKQSPCWWGGRQLKSQSAQTPVASEWGEDGIWGLSGQCTRSRPASAQPTPVHTEWLLQPASLI